jgi:sulfatase maturation enzyme AslB (radical SAM superfamily)
VPLAEKIYFAGGEPLLAAEHYEILDALIACKNTNLEIIYNTNFTTLKYRDRSVLDLWKHFSNITVGASLDAYKEIAEYVRHGTNWTVIESNLKILKSQCPHVNFIVMSTVGLLNVSGLIKLQKNWHETKKLDISKFFLTIMMSPDHLALPVLPETHKARLNDLITAHINWCESNGADSLAKQWNSVLSYMWSKDTSYNLTEFQRLTKIMDGHRKESLIDVLPEYKDLI